MNAADSASGVASGNLAAFAQLGMSTMSSDLSALTTKFLATSDQNAVNALVKAFNATYSATALPEAGAGMNLNQAITAVKNYVSGLIATGAGNNGEKVSATDFATIDRLIGSASPAKIIQGAPNAGLLAGVSVTNPQQAIALRDVDLITLAKALVIGDDITMMLAPSDAAAGTKDITLRYDLSKYIASGVDFVTFSADATGSTVVGTGGTNVKSLVGKANAPTGNNQVSVTVNGFGEINKLSNDAVDPASPRMPVFDKNLNVKVLINAQDDARNSADPKANPTYDGVVKLSTTLNNLYSANVDTVDVDNKTYNAKNPKTADLTKAKVSLGLGQMTAILDADLNAAGQSVFTAAPTKFLGSMKVVLAILASDAPAGSADPKGNVSWADLNKTETINLVAFLNTLSSASSNIDAITMSASVKDAIDASLKRWAQPSLDKLLAGKVDVTAVAAPTVTLNNKLVTGAGAVESVAGPNGDFHRLEKQQRGQNHCTDRCQGRRQPGRCRLRYGQQDQVGGRQDQCQHGGDRCFRLCVFHGDRKF